MLSLPKNPVAYIKRWPHLQTEEICLAALAKNINSYQYIKIQSEAIQHYIVEKAPILLWTIDRPYDSTLMIYYNDDRKFRLLQYAKYASDDFLRLCLATRRESIRLLYKITPVNIIMDCIKNRQDFYCEIPFPTEEMVVLYKMLWEV